MDDTTFDTPSSRPSYPSQSRESKSTRGIKGQAFGAWKSIIEWSRDPRCKIGYDALLARIRKGEELESAMTRVPDPSASTRAASRHFEAFGESKTLVCWAADPRCKVSYGTLQERIRNGIPLTDAFQRGEDIRPNKRKKATAFGETKSVREWVNDKRCSVSLDVLLHRLKDGMEPEDAISLRHRYGNDLQEAFGEHKLMMDWARDSRCVVSFQSLYKRVHAGMPLDEAMTTPMVRNIPKHKVWPPVTAFGETKSVMDWSKDVRCVVSEMTLRTRLREGFEPEEALTYPAYRGVPKKSRDWSL